MAVSANGRPLFLAYEETCSGFHPGAAAEARASKGFPDPALLIRELSRALAAGSGALDLIILADAGAATRHPGPAIGFEPFTLASFLAGAIGDVGLAIAAAPSRVAPFNLARLAATADHISDGRIALQLDGAPAGSDETIAVLRALWDSWEDDAFVRDKASGEFVRPEKLHTIDHHGPRHRVRGPLNVARSPQGNPPIIAFWPPGEDAPAADILRTPLGASGRRPPRGGPVLTLADAPALVAETDAEAWRAFDRLNAGIPAGSTRIADAIGLTDVPTVDEPLSETAADGLNPHGRALWAVASGHLAQRRAALPDAVAAPSLRDLLGASLFPTPVAVGSPASVARFLENWADEERLDGFVFRPLGGFEQLALLQGAVFPLLGEISAETRETLRERLGLPRPESRFAAPVRKVKHG